MLTRDHRAVQIEHDGVKGLRFQRIGDQTGEQLERVVFHRSAQRRGGGDRKHDLSAEFVGDREVAAKAACRALVKVDRGLAGQQRFAVGTKPRHRGGNGRKRVGFMRNASDQNAHDQYPNNTA